MGDDRINKLEKRNSKASTGIQEKSYGNKQRKAQVAKNEYRKEMRKLKKKAWQNTANKWRKRMQQQSCRA